MVQINQSVAILIDGNNIEKSLHSLVGDSNAMLNFDTLISKLLVGRGLSRLIYFREGISISSKLAGRLHENYFGSVVPCYKSADIPLSIKAMQIAQKVDTIVIMSGDADYVELVRHLKSEGVRVEIAAIPQTTAKILLDEADYFYPITREHCFIYNKNGGRTTQKKAIPEKRQPVEEKKTARPAQGKMVEKRENPIHQKPVPDKKEAFRITNNTRTTQRRKVNLLTPPRRQNQEERTPPPAPAQQKPVVAKPTPKPTQQDNSAKAKPAPRKKSTTKRSTPKRSTAKTRATEKGEKKVAAKTKTGTTRKKASDSIAKAEKKATTRKTSRGGRKKKVED